MKEYRTLEQIFTNKQAFITQATSTTMNGLSAYYTLTPYTQEELNKLSLGVVSPIFYAIYDYYYNDNVAYVREDDFDDKDKTQFLNRLCTQIIRDLPNYIVKFNFQDIIKALDTTRYDITSHMLSSSSEKGVSGSSVVQSSGSTPTGVNNEQTGSEMSITKQTQGDTTSVSLEDDTYTSKYTNYQAKTNGIHDNDVSRDGEVTRKGGLLDIINLVNNLPQNFYDKVLKDVAKHFIFLYE